MNVTQGDAGRPDRRVPSAATTFYRYRNVTVTGRLLVVDGREYRLTELSDLRTGRGPRDGLTGLLAIATGTGVLATVLLASRLDFAWWFGALVSLLVLGGGLGYRMWSRPRLHELLAEYRGVVVVLLAEPDGVRFGQICRALNHALESET
jgi:hypothetical protein